MEKKLLKLDEIVTVLRDYAIELENWSDEYEESLSKEINDLFHIVTVLEVYQDYLIFMNMKMSE